VVAEDLSLGMRDRAEIEAAVRGRYERIRESLNERARRLFVAAEALALGHGGIAMVSRATGVAPRTLGLGIAELRAIEAGDRMPLDTTRSRRPGGGRKKLIVRDPELLPALRLLVESATRGDPESALLWTSRSLRHLTAELVAAGHKIGKSMVARLLRHELGYSLQSNRKRVEGAQHPDRDAQFQNIDEKVRQEIAKGNPVLSVDTKKKELVGNFKNGGRELAPKGQPEEVNVHDFPEDLGKAAPYGVFDIAKNEAWVSVGISHDTAEFSVNAIRTWWNAMGHATYAAIATAIMITADCGGSNGYRLRLWKVELQKLVNEIGLPISVSHLPPGTSKWNRVEHRVFSFITQNWRGKPLITHKVVVGLIGATTTKTGLKVHCQLDEQIYTKGRRVTDRQLDAVNLVPDDFHGEWNYTIKPNGQVAESIR
jgi:hypothetical protein